MKHRLGLNATALRIFALAVMLLDHIGAVLFPGELWMRIVGRLAFPIFAFQIAEGYRHTHSFRRYYLRVLAFGLISEIPFDLMLTRTVFNPFHQNVMLTLLMGLLAIRQLDILRARPSAGYLLICGGKLALILLVGVLLSPDYGVLGVLTVIAFHLLRDFPGAKAAQLIAMTSIHFFGYEGPTVSLFRGTMRLPLQAFAILALVPIWLYNGEKGDGGKRFQFAAYAFYPAHMLILGILQLR